MRGRIITLVLVLAGIFLGAADAAIPPPAP